MQPVSSKSSTSWLSVPASPGCICLHRLRELDLRVIVLEAGTDVGGTWYWNRYPGARCDAPSLEYSLSFDDALQQEWSWSEVMSPQPEILEYAGHVADRYGLRSQIRTETRVVGATYDDDLRTWQVRTDAGERLACQFLIMATGCLSASNVADIAGRDDFAGQLLHTGEWPKEPVDFSGQRVGVIGTGSSGVQAIPVIAEEAGHLTVFQRTPVFTFPANNRPLRDEVQQSFKDHYDDIRQRQRASATGFSGFSPPRGGNAERRANAEKKTDVEPEVATPKKRRKPVGILDLDDEQRWDIVKAKGPGVFLNWRDIYSSPEANEVACDLYRRYVAHLVDDPEVAAKLQPKDYPLGCKRQVYDTNYYETFNRDNVALVDLRADPIDRITPSGIQTSSDHIDLDILVFATGFDAMTGALDRIDIRGREGRLLRDEWAAGPRSYLGLAIEGFPNLFTITGPGSPSVLSNVVVSIEQHVDWIIDCLGYLEARSLTAIEAQRDAQDGWVEHVNEVAVGTMYTAPNCGSWYLGANIDGKPRVFMPYVGGVGRYRSICDEVSANDYEGFALS